MRSHWDRRRVMVLPTARECTRLTLLVASENPELNISQGEDGNGLRDTFLQLVLNSRGPQELDTEQQDTCVTVKTHSGQMRGLRSTRSPSCPVLFLHRQLPAGPLCSWWPCWRSDDSPTTTPTHPPPGPCRPAPASAIRPPHTPGEQHRCVLMEAD